uniref:Uncharacterized protein n=1 Tax=Picea glauca TaxID=3330 RepID=A0A101M3P8_PICGL|nr:hypothetical protein ABT39_MTgene334 [Picea glauca]
MVIKSKGGPGDKRRVALFLWSSELTLPKGNPSDELLLTPRTRDKKPKLLIDEGEARGEEVKPPAVHT